MSFPDAESALLDVADAAGIIDLQHSGTVTPPDLETRLPFARATRHGGADDRVTDTARISIDVFAATRAEAQTISEQLRDTYTARGGHVANNGVIDSVTTDTGPFEVPWGNPNIRRFTAAYRVSARR